MTTNATLQPDPDSASEIAKHSSVGKMIEGINKAFKRNAAMPTGELWQYHLRPLIAELHEFHIDYTDEAVDENEDAPDPDYVEALVEFVGGAKALIMASTALLGGAFATLGYLDEKGEPIMEKMPKEVVPAFVEFQKQLKLWTDEYPNLIEETLPGTATVAPTVAAPTVVATVSQVVEQAVSGATS